MPKKLSEGLTVKSSLPGRIRFMIKGLKKNAAMAQLLENELAALDGVEEVQSNLITGSLLVKYSPVLSAPVVTSYLENLYTGNNKFKAPSQEPAAKNTPVVTELSSRTHFWQVALTGFNLAYLGLRKLLRPKAALADSLALADLAAIVTVISGFPLFKKGVMMATRRGRINHELLLGTLSLLALLLRENFVGLAMLWLIHLTNYLRTAVAEKTKETVLQITQAPPHKAWVLVDNAEIEVPSASLEQGQIVVVRAGETIPVDGVVSSGSALINQALLTGESNQITRHAGDQVYAGTRIEAGSMHIEVVKAGENTLLGEIVKTAVQNVKDETQAEHTGVRYINRVTPLSCLLAFGIYLWTRDYRRSLAVLLAAAPSEVSLAVPTALGSAVATAAADNVLIVNSSKVEELASANTYIFDKTGTLTGTASNISEIIPLRPGITAEMLVALAASLEKEAHHPLARAFMQKADELGIKVKSVKTEHIPGHGLKAIVKGSKVVIGSAHFMQDEKISLRTGRLKAKKLESSCNSIVYIAYNGEVIGLVGISEQLQPDARNTIRQLRALGILELGLVTGDSAQAAEKVAEELNLNPVWPANKPLEKLQVINELKSKNKKVVMIGDGINDLPALKGADVGIAIGRDASPATLKNADIIIPEHELSKLPSTVFLSKKTREIIKQNLAITIGLNSTGLALATGNLISPGSLALLHNGAALAVILNSARLWPWKKKQSTRK